MNNLSVGGRDCFAQFFAHQNSDHGPNQLVCRYSFSGVCPRQLCFLIFSHGRCLYQVGHKVCFVTMGIARSISALWIAQGLFQYYGCREVDFCILGCKKVEFCTTDCTNEVSALRGSLSRFLYYVCHRVNVCIMSVTVSISVLGRSQGLSLHSGCHKVDFCTVD